MTEYSKIEINGDIPRYMKLIMVFIDRVGFPVLAFILMFYLAFSSLQKSTEAIAENTKALVLFTAVSSEFQHGVLIQHEESCAKLDALLQRRK